MSQNNDNHNTKDKIIQTGIRLFAKNGYEATTMRMIANDAGINIALISFYFGNKENFYKSVLEYVANDISPYYNSVYNKIEVLKREKGFIDKEEALDLIVQLVNLQLYIALNQQEPWPDYVSLLYWEQRHPPEGNSPFTEKVTLEVEDTLSFLLTQYEPSLDYRKASIISRFINGGIISFSEHPGFTKIIKDKIGENTSEDFIKNTLEQFIISSI